MLFRLKRPCDSAVRRAARIYFGVQSVAVLAWWFVLYILPSLRPLFFPSNVLEGGLKPWFAADIATVVIPSAVAAVFTQSRPRLIVAAALAAFGSLVVANVFCAVWAFRNGLFLSSLLMIPALAGSAVATYAVARKT